MKKLLKRNKRLYVVENNTVIYSPPNHLRDHIRSREDLGILLEEREPFIDLVFEFEKLIWDRYLKKRYPKYFNSAP